MTTHRERAAEYADAAVTMRSMAEALELRAAEELALAREVEIEAEERAADWAGFRFGSSISAGVPCWPPLYRIMVDPELGGEVFVRVAA